MLPQPIFVAGGAGFIGSNLVLRLLIDGERVVIYDNFSSGRLWHLGKSVEDKSLTIVQGDLKDLASLQSAMEEARPETVYHFASNPDIARGMTDPLIDFWEGTLLTQNVAEAARRVGTVKRIMYASGSGVYGDMGETPVVEGMCLSPSSSYGASKLAGEALLSASCAMYGLQARCFRFANVVGGSQTHGVTFDFIKKLTANPTELEILGDGRQSKSYIHVTDIIAAMRRLEPTADPDFDCFNVATTDYATVNEIADMAVQEMSLQGVTYRYSGGSKGWKGDVPVVRFNSEKIRSTGWANRYTTKEALRLSLRSTIAAVKAGLITVGKPGR
jgi:UDP-glucose 4-epimerase